MLTIKRFQRDTLFARTTRRLVIAWMAAFLLGIGPGHTRGIIQFSHNPVADTTRSPTPVVSSSRSCCGRSNTPDQPARPTGHCAICKIIATLDLPPALIDPTPALLAVHVLHNDTTDRCATHDVALRLRGRAPPTA